MVRIIAGTARGRKLETLEGMETRPTLDRVKEAMFGSLQFRIPYAKVLDLFAGSGAMGLEALLAVANKDASLIITGNGDVLEPEEGLIAIGSGGPYAQSAARALLRHTDLSAREIVESSLGIAGEICIYTNQNQTIEELDADT